MFDRLQLAETLCIRFAADRQKLRDDVEAGTQMPRLEQMAARARTQCPTSKPYIPTWNAFVVGAAVL